MSDTPLPPEPTPPSSLAEPELNQQPTGPQPHAPRRQSGLVELAIIVGILVVFFVAKQYLGFG